MKLRRARLREDAKRFGRALARLLANGISGCLHCPRWVGAKLATAVFLSICLQNPAQAQALYVPQAPSHVMLDERHVDMLSGAVMFSDVELSIGSKEQGLTFARNWPGGGDWRHTYMFSIEGWWDEYSVWHVAVSAGNSGNEFTRNNTNYISEKADGSSLVENTTSFIYTDHDGQTVLFDKSLVPEYSGGAAPLALGTYITRPDGVKIYLRYETTNYTYWSGTASSTRLRSVENSFGYQIRFSYETNALSIQNIANWQRLTKVQAVNMAVDNCDALSNSCAFSQIWPSISYAMDTANGKEDVTDPAGRVTRYSWPVGGMAIRYPGSTADDITYTYDPVYPYLKGIQTSSGGSWSYTRSGNIVTKNNVTSATHTVTYPPHDAYHYAFNITDENSNLKSLLYDHDYNLVNEQFPLGNQNTYTYDGRGNLTQIVSTPKPGSGLQTRTVSIAYPTSCTNSATCNKPISMTDALRKTTNYFYNADGSIDYVQSPAAATGSPRPEIHFTYTTAQARIKNAAGTIVNQGDVVSLPTGSVKCVTAAWPCAAADQIVEQVSYPQGSSATNLLAQSSTVASGSGTPSSTTNFAYDGVGNKTAITSPAGNLTTISYAVDRQPTLELSPSADGLGSSLRLAKQYHYNARGIRDITSEGYYNPVNQSFVPVTVKNATFDNQGRKKQESVSDGTSTLSLAQYSYDTESRLQCAAVRMNPSIYAALPSDACTLGTQGSAGPDRITKNIYDPAGQLLQVRKAVGTPLENADATYAYSPNGKQTDVIDANGNHAQMAYDGFDRQTGWYFPSTTKPTAYVAGSAATSVTTTNCAGQTITASTASSFSNAGSANCADYEAYGYDANNNRTSLKKRDGTTLTYQNEPSRVSRRLFGLSHATISRFSMAA